MSPTRSTPSGGTRTRSPNSNSSPNVRQVHNFTRFGNSVIINNSQYQYEKINRKLMKESLKQKKLRDNGKRYWDKKARRWKEVNKTNVKGYYKQNFTNAGAAKHIKKHKRVYIDVDLRNGKVQHVYDVDGIIRLLTRNGTLHAKSPLTRKTFSMKNVQPF